MRPSAELAVMLSPSRELRRLAQRNTPGTWTRASVGPALFALVAGSVAAAGTTGVLTPRLLLGSVACWVFMPLLQVVNGLVLIRGCTLDRRRAIELLFHTQGPWLIWFLGLAVAVMIDPRAQMLALPTVVIPAAWTWWLLVLFSTEVLGLSARSARRRVLAHALITLAFVAAYTQLTFELLTRMAELIP